MIFNALLSASLLTLLVYSLGEIRKLMPVCSNSCLANKDSSTRNCYCDSKCSLVFNDCCLDAPYRTFRMAIRRRTDLRCVFVHGENRNFWMVNQCKDSWQGHTHIKEKCVATTIVSSESSDLIGSLPVTDSKDDLTYINYYCALCNSANPEDLTEWRVKALCSSTNVTQNEILQNLTYIEDKQQWGVWKWNDNNELLFENCYLLFEKPTNITHGVRDCIPGMISTCPRTWHNITTRRKCKSYVDPVMWDDGFIYRNIDCAVCHNRNATGYQCVDDVAKHSNSIMLSRAMHVDLSCSGQWF